MKKLVILLSLVVLGFVFVGCGETTTEATTAAPTTQAPVTTDAPGTDAPTTVAPTTDAPTTEAPIAVQGVTDTTIIVGNTAATSGYFATVGIPFNDAIEAVFKQVNDAGGIDGRTISLVHYDDGFDSAQGLTYTNKLIDEDKVFALVGHFGTPTVGATVDLIQEVGIPMVYAATGINALYFQESVGNPVMAVQPIYMTDGRIMAARAIYEDLYGASGDQTLPTGAKIGVVYTNDDVGNSLKAGIEVEAELAGMEDDFIYAAVTSGSFNTAITTLYASGVSAVLLAMNQEPFGYALTSMSNLGLNVPVFTSYVNADVSVVDHYRYNAARPIYTNAWVDVATTEGQAAVADYVACIMQADLDEATKTAYYTNAFATAGYIAAKVFIEGLERIAANEEDLTWANYIAAMEEGPIDIPMGGIVDFSGGKRWGIASMSMLEYGFTYGDNPATTETTETDFLLEAFTKVREIETVEEIELK